jgi:serine/threonine-protein kinase TNNI3K
VTLEGSGQCSEFVEWNIARLTSPGVRFERSLGAFFLVDDQSFRVDAPLNLPFSQLKIILARDLNLYCEFSVLANDCVIDDKTILSALEGPTEFTIRRIPRGHEIAAFNSDLSKFTLIDDFEGDSQFPVQLYENGETHERIAVKKFQRKIQEELFKRELETLAQFHHPCIVPLFGYVPRVARKGPKLATYFMEAGSLADALRSSPSWFTPTRKSIIIVGIVIGMIYVHESGFMHRDLKPSNILLDGNHRPRISDFGSGRHELTRHSMTAGVGTLQYTAPEIFANVPYTNKVDVYSFTLILYEILFGRPVFSSSLGVVELGRQKEQRGAVVIPGDVPPFVGQLIRRGSSPTAAERPSFQEILQELIKHNFCITDNVGASEVASFLVWVRKCHWKNPAISLITAVGRSGAAVGRFDYKLYVPYGIVLREACSNIRPAVVDQPTLFIEIAGHRYFLDVDTHGILKAVPQISESAILRVVAADDAPAVRCPPVFVPLMMDFDSFPNVRTPKFLGRGASGSVYLMKDSLGQDVAYKQFHGVQDCNSMRELSILLKVDHRAIVRLLYVIPRRHLSGGYDIATEYCANRSVLDAIKDNLLTATRKMIVLVGTASAMAYLHKRRICHRDLKPGDILLDSNWRPKLCDFGLAKQLGHQGSSRRFVSEINGTEIYMAPELFSDKPNKNHLYGDVYSYGVTAYHIITGQLPFHDLGRHKAMTKIEKGNRPHLGDIEAPEGMKRLISECWEHSPEYRPKFCQIVDELLRPQGSDIFLPGTDFTEYQAYASLISLSIA